VLITTGKLSVKLHTFYLLLSYI